MDFRQRVGPLFREVEGQAKTGRHIEVVCQLKEAGRLGGMLGWLCNCDRIQEEIQKFSQFILYKPFLKVRIRKRRVLYASPFLFGFRPEMEMSLQVC